MHLASYMKVFKQVETKSGWEYIIPISQATSYNWLKEVDGFLETMRVATSNVVSILK